MLRLGHHRHRVRPGTGLRRAGVPVSKISIQLWTFAEYVGFGTDAATIARLEEVLSSLSEMGYRNVEPFTSAA